MWGADIIFIDLQYNGKYRYYFNMKEAHKLKIVIYFSFCFMFSSLFILIINDKCIFVVNGRDSLCSLVHFPFAMIIVWICFCVVHWPLTFDTLPLLFQFLRSRILMNSVLTFQFCVALCYKHGHLWLLQHVLSRAHLEIWRNTNKHNFFNSSSASEIFWDIDLCVFNIAPCKKWDVLGNKIGGKHSERSENSSRTASCVFFASQTNYQALFTQTQGKLSFIQNLGSNFLTWGTESFLLDSNFYLYPGL